MAGLSNFGRSVTYTQSPLRGTKAPINFSSNRFIPSFGGLGGQYELLAAEMVAKAYEQEAAVQRLGGEIAAQGYMFQAEGFRTSAEAVKQATEFNINVDNMNLKRQLDTLSRQFQRTAGQQIVGAAASGFSVGSKSFMQLRDETANVFATAFTSATTDAKNKQRIALYESQVKQTNLENQAKAAEYQAQGERVLAGARAQSKQLQANAERFRGQATFLARMFGG